MFDALFAFENTTKLAVYPESVEIPELDPIVFLVNPVNDGVQSSIYVFNSETTYFFTWSFTYNSKPNALVITSSKLYASLFVDFLKSVQASFRGSQDTSDCLCRFGFVKSLLLSWTALSISELRVTYPLASFTFDIGCTTSWLADFNVGLLYPRIESVWRALMTGNRVVIFGETPELASAAAIAALSLVQPLIFSDKVLLYTDHRDERVKDQSYVIIGTTDPSLRTLPNSFLVHVRGTQVGDMSETQKKYQDKTSRYYTIMLYLMDLELMTNPYFDLLETFVNVRNRDLPNDVDRSLLEEMQATESFKRWRRKKMSRDSIRTAFLSMSPAEAVAKIPREKYDDVLEHIEIIRNFFSSDLHFTAVLKAHAHEIRKLKKSEISQ